MLEELLRRSGALTILAILIAVGFVGGRSYEKHRGAKAVVATKVSPNYGSLSLPIANTVSEPVATLVPVTTVIPADLLPDAPIEPPPVTTAPAIELPPPVPLPPTDVNPPNSPDALHSTPPSDSIKPTVPATPRQHTEPTKLRDQTVDEQIVEITRVRKEIARIAAEESQVKNQLVIRRVAQQEQLLYLGILPAGATAPAVQSSERPFDLTLPAHEDRPAFDHTYALEKRPSVDDLLKQITSCRKRLALLQQEDLKKVDILRARVRGLLQQLEALNILVD